MQRRVSGRVAAGEGRAALDQQLHDLGVDAILARQMNRRHSKLVLRVKVPMRRLHHLLHHHQPIMLGGSVEQVLFPVSSRLHRRRKFLNKVLQLRAKVRLGASIIVDQIVQPVVDRQLPVDREESVLAVLLDLIMPELSVVVN